MLLYRRDGIVGLDEVYFLAANCEDAKVSVLNVPVVSQLLILEYLISMLKPFHTD